LEPQKLTKLQLEFYVKLDLRGELSLSD